MLVTMHRRRGQPGTYYWNEYTVTKTDEHPGFYGTVWVISKGGEFQEIAESLKEARRTVSQACGLWREWDDEPNQEG